MGRGGAWPSPAPGHAPGLWPLGWEQELPVRTRRVRWASGRALPELSPDGRSPPVPQITTTAELLSNRGVINQFMGYVGCAMKDYQQAIALDPGYALAYFNAANVYFFNRQFPQAYSYYSKAMALDPKNESAFLNRAITNTLLKNFEEAKADFEAALSLSPFSAAIYFNKANLHNALGDYEQAEKDISKALSIQPYDALMHKLRADVRGKMGLIKEAVADYKNAISIQELISGE
ncbi:hypothetical protein lerEdw1_004887 [Lerista edwardsae]|nr:hypothetical protein lerEdw1_004887 [Lerista edwardsae]